MERTVKNTLNALTGTLDDLSPEELQKIVALLTAEKNEGSIPILAMHLKMLAGIKLTEQAAFEFKNL
jgi:hypothetical protein